MKKIECCQYCGAKKIVYKRSLRPVMIHFLRRISLHQIPVKLSDIWGISPNQYPDVKRLFLWGLIEERKRFHYLITETGRDFLNGDIKLPYSVFTYRNKLVNPPFGEDVELVYVNEIDHEEINRDVVIKESTNKSEYDKSRCV